MNAWSNIKFFWIEEIYSIITMLYLTQLNTLNKELLLENFESPMQLLVYDGWRPIKFFAMALVLFGAGLVVLWQRGNQIRYGELTYCEILKSIFALILVMTFLVLIIIFIDNPILKAVMIVCGIGVAILYADAN